MGLCIRRVFSVKDFPIGSVLSVVLTRSRYLTADEVMILLVAGILANREVGECRIDLCGRVRRSSRNDCLIGSVCILSADKPLVLVGVVLIVILRFYCRSVAQGMLLVTECCGVRFIRSLFDTDFYIGHQWIDM